VVAFGPAKLISDDDIVQQMLNLVPCRSYGLYSRSIGKSKGLYVHDGWSTRRREALVP